MKRYLTAFLAAVMLLSITACGLIRPQSTSQPGDGPAEKTPPITSGAPGSSGEDGTDKKDTDSAGGDYWENLREKWRSEKEEGYVWTVSIDAMTVLDALGLAECTYDLDLSCSHVGKDMNGVYAGRLAMRFDADLSGLNEMIGALGGTASTSHTDGWFRNDNFVMELKPYDAEKEQAFIGSLDLALDENMEIVPKNESDPYTDAIVGPMLEQMGSGTEQFEKDQTPVSYWFDWDYNMTEGDMSQSYSVTGIMGIASASGGMDASGKHISGSAVAHSPLGGVYTDRYDETLDAPFPYIIRVYETGQVVFELHSSSGGPVVIKFYGTIDKIPVSETTVIKN